MCAGAIAWFKVKKCVIGDSKNMDGREGFLRGHGIEVVALQSR